MTKLITVILVALFVSACSSVPTPLNEAIPAPAEHVFFRNHTSAGGMAKAVFVRDRGAMMAGGYLHLYINGVKAASLNTGEKLELSLKPDDYVFGVLPTDPLGMYSLYSIDQELKAGKSYYYRLLIDVPDPTNPAIPRIQRFMPLDTGSR